MQSYCSHCYRPLPTDQSNYPCGKASATSSSAPRRASCPNCAQKLEAANASCPSCGYRGAGGTSSSSFTPSARGQSTPPYAQPPYFPSYVPGRTESATQSGTAQKGFGTTRSSAKTVWSIAALIALLIVCWVGSSIIHSLQGAGLNGVYESSEGAGDVTFWPNGTYLWTNMGPPFPPGKYEVRNNGTVDMEAQLKSILHPGANASQSDQAAAMFANMFASGMDGTMSPDKNTFQWQGQTFSYESKPTTQPPSVPDATTSGGAASSAPSGAASPSAMSFPTAQQLQQAAPKPDDSFHVNTDVNPATADPNQIGEEAMRDSEWNPNGPKMQQYYRTHPQHVLPTGATPVDQSAGTSSGQDSGAAPLVPANAPPPTGYIMPDENIEEELKKVK